MPCLYRVLALAPAATSTATSGCTMVDDALSVSIVSDGHPAILYLFSLQVDLKPLREAAVAVPAPKITEKRKAEDADASKDLKKVNIFGLFALCLKSDLINYSAVLKVAFKIGSECLCFKDTIELRITSVFSISKLHAGFFRNFN
ncbi:hypothetical protein ALC60_03822 [Trachymyrmex zeteki]|uniref:Uncharacterized protein n=1 Tax=Mycetomoellerius zeteki TaxID=64791 RepID=A0A151XAE4_9HYME|nr:hypothetical protein ALC60_03822 [Trachymyrmex zeteki]